MMNVPTWKDSLEIADNLLHPCLSLALSLVGTSREEFAKDVLEFLVELGLFDAGG